MSKPIQRSFTRMIMMVAEAEKRHEYPNLKVEYLPFPIINEVMVGLVRNILEKRCFV